MLQTRDGIDLTDEQILERARNIVTGLLGNYRIRSIDPREPRNPAGVAIVQPDIAGNAFADLHGQFAGWCKYKGLYGFLFFML